MKLHKLLNQKFKVNESLIMILGDNKHDTFIYVSVDKLHHSY